jgi:hypothetical protein
MQRRENLLRLCRELCPATPSLPECVSHFAFVLQSTLHQKLMSSKANTYYSDLKVQALRSTRALNAPHMLILASQAATIDKGRTSFVAKK